MALVDYRGDTQTMTSSAKLGWALFLSVATTVAQAQVAEKAVDIPTRPGVTERMVVLSPHAPKATVILFAGGHGGLQIGSSGSFGWGEGNFLVRTRALFAEQGLLTIVVDAPSDRQKPPYLGGFRQTPEHVADIKAVIAWARQQANVPVWLVGTSRGTQSAAFIATQLSGPDAPDGLVLTSTMLSDDVGRPVPAMPLDRVKIPVLVVHHEQDGCKHCAFSQIPSLMDKLGGAPKTQMIAFKGGQTRGDPCEAFAYHGFNGIERDVVAQIAGWITAK
jgi:acetyl esterase/lipase